MVWTVDDREQWKTYFDNIQLMSYDRNAEVGTAATMTIDITPMNDAPTDLSLSANTVAENAVNGTVVGTVRQRTDPDSGDTKAYSLTDNAGGRFAINSVTGQITVANSSLLNYEAATSHNVTVRVTDSGGLTYDETFTINLTDVNEANSHDHQQRRGRPHQSVLWKIPLRSRP